ncbi:hypothetical protein D3C72_2432560 [compost metagenome]
MVRNSTTTSVSGTEVTPSAVMRVNPEIAMKALIMNTSPCAKLIMPMMPYTMV